jgi:hypothetical protein
MPIMAVTDRFDGRLTRISMLFAYLVALGAIIHLGWRLRRVVWGDDLVGRFEAASAGVVTFGAGTSTLLFLGAKPWVYHEALLWGTALALASFAALVRWLVEPERGRGWRGLVWAATLAGAALLTRPSVGAGPVVALGLVGLRELWQLRSPAARSRSAWTRVAAVFVGAVLPLVAYAAVNQAKFGSPFKLPTDAQVLVSFDADRQAALEANDGSLFGLHFAPSVLWQAVRPDAVGTRRVFPFLGFPSERPTAFGDVVFAELDWSSSVPASEPLLVLLGLVGVVALVVPDRVAAGATRLRELRMPVLGAAAAGGGLLVLGYIANRYLSDVIPLVVLTGLVGAAVVVRWALGRARGARVAVLGAMAVLALWGAWVNTSLGLQYQREIAPGAPGDSRADWLVWQARLGPNPRFVRLGPDDPLPSPERVGRVAVVGRCGGLYRSTGGDWQPVEGGPETGRFDLDVVIDEPLAGAVTLVEGTGAGGQVARIQLEPVEDGAVLPSVTSITPKARKTLGGSASIPLAPGEPRHLRVTLDPRIDYAEVRDVDGGTTPLSWVIDLPQVPVHVVEGGPVHVTEHPPSTRACRAIGAG